MTFTTAIVISMSFHPIFALPTATWQPSRPKEGNVVNLAPLVTKKKAVLLVPGLHLHVFRPERSLQPEQQDWQTSSAKLVKELSADFDVYAMSYAQTMPLDVVIYTTGMRQQIAKLKELGYREIILIGHSAGGVIARQFVERFPNSGVTKVIQVAAPNTGSEYATIGLGISKIQLPFLRSISPEVRNKATTRLVKLPSDLDFCCVVCKGGNRQSDTIVEFNSQWPEDLQKQGVPAVLVTSYHNEAVKGDIPVKAIGELAREKLVRWSKEDVETAKKVVFQPITNRSRGLGFIRP